MNANSWLEINLARLDANVAALRSLIGAPAVEPLATTWTPEVMTARAAGSSTAVAARAGASAAAVADRPTQLCAVVKADAYGLGVAPIAQRLAAHGADMLAVYSPAQAEQLTALAFHLPILVLMRMAELSRNEPLYRLAVTQRLHLSIHDREQMLELEHVGRMFGIRLPVHLYVDTGMSRGGVGLDDVGPMLTELTGLRNVRLAGVYTHLASDGDPGLSNEQVTRLDAVLAEHDPLLPPDLLVHVANTCATLCDSRYHRDMVRVGLGLFGYGPGDLCRRATLAAQQALRPIVRWLARVVHVRRVPAGATVGYGCTHRLGRDSVLGVVPAGYADGYPLALSNQASVLLPEWTIEDRPVAARVLGRVNMDQVVIDLTDAPDAGVGTLAELISDDPAAPCALPELAKLAGSSCYEMLCRLSPRLPRKYVTA